MPNKCRKSNQQDASTYIRSGRGKNRDGYCSYSAYTLLYSKVRETVLRPLLAELPLELFFPRLQATESIQTQLYTSRDRSCHTSHQNITCQYFSRAHTKYRNDFLFLRFYRGQPFFHCSSLSRAIRSQTDIVVVSKLFIDSNQRSLVRPLKPLENLNVPRLATLSRKCKLVNQTSKSQKQHLHYTTSV